MNLSFMRYFLASLALCCVIGCSDTQAEQSSDSKTNQAVVAPPLKLQARTGDLDTLIQSRIIRIGVPFSKTGFYTVKGRNFGAFYEAGKEFEAYLNRKYPQKNKNIKTHILFVIFTNERAAANLAGGSLNILMGGITITPERQKLFDFSDLMVSNIKEIVVTAPHPPPLTSVDDLSGREVFVRKTSAHWEYLARLNERFEKEEKPAVKLRAAPEDLVMRTFLRW